MQSARTDVGRLLEGHFLFFFVKVNQMIIFIIDTFDNYSLNKSFENTYRKFLKPKMMSIKSPKPRKYSISSQRRERGDENPHI